MIKRERGSSLKKRAEIVIIGGGIIGSSIAYYLAFFGGQDILLLDKGSFCNGSTGRCAAGLRQQWGTEMNCVLARESIKLFATLEEDLRYSPGIELKQGGYLILLHNEREVEQAKKNVSLQNKLGIPSDVISPREAREIVKELNMEGIVGATFCPTDGHANPFHVTNAYALAAKELGVVAEYQTEVLAIEERDGSYLLTTNRGELEASIVVNAAGGRSQNVASLLGLSIPAYSERRQILVTEPLDFFLEPMIISFKEHIYCQQTPHGSFLMGMGDPSERPGSSVEPTWAFLKEMTKRATTILPFLRDVRVIRQWAGLYTMTPDAQPILGPVKDLPQFFQAIGFSGHGFMLAPIVGRLMAQSILGFDVEMDISRLDLGRFERKELIEEPSVV